MNTKRSLLFSVLIFISWLPANGTEPTTIPEEIKTEIRKRVDNYYSTAMVVGIMDSNGASYFSYGTLDPDGGKTVTEDSLFYVGGECKKFTTTILADTCTALWAATSGSGVIPNDEEFASQWNLTRIDATHAWTITTGSSNVVIAIIDNGVQIAHPDLVDNLWRNPGETGLDANGQDKATNGLDDDGNGYIDDVHGIDTGENDSDPSAEPDLRDNNRGTLSAGLIGAVGNNGIGVAGLNWQVQLMAIKSFRAPPDDYVPLIGDLTEAFKYVVDMKKRGVNIRAICNAYTQFPTQAWQDAVTAASDAGIMVVCAAGNQGWSTVNHALVHPARFDALGILSVAATTSEDALDSNSNYGRTGVHLAAPGGNLPSTRGESYGLYSGTGAAAAQVTGAIGLLCAARPESTVAELKAALLHSVDQPAILKTKVMCNGRLNVARALNMLGDTSLPPIVIHVAPAAVTELDHAHLTITFSKPMNRASVEAALTVTNSLQGAIPGSCIWTDDSQTLTFRPTASLAGCGLGYVTLRATAQDSTGLFLDGDFNGTAAGDATDDFTWTFCVSPVNDQNSIPISGPCGSVQVSNVGATAGAWHINGPENYAGVPSTATVSYRWVAPSSEEYAFHTSDTTLDTVLEIFLWEDPVDDHDYFVAGMNDDEDGGGKTSRVEFTATKGSGYTVAVDTKSKTGSFVLSWSPLNAPVVQPEINSITLQGGNVAIEFSGVLQSAGQVSGPWQDASGASTPFLAPVQDGMRFWRTRAP
ncbi:MAG: S8 family serine peptidase [Verrucomicrobiia bacterium]